MENKAPAGTTFCLSDSIDQCVIQGKPRFREQGETPPQGRKSCKGTLQSLDVGLPWNTGAVFYNSSTTVSAST